MGDKFLEAFGLLELPLLRDGVAMLIVSPQLLT
jgi:hypothetical protein